MTLSTTARVVALTVVFTYCMGSTIGTTVGLSCGAGGMSLGTAICSLGTAASLPEVLLVWVTILPEIVVASLRIIRGDSGTGTKGAADVPSVLVASQIGRAHV